MTDGARTPIFTARRRRSAALFVAFCALAGCAPEPATYAPPTDEQAIAAVKNGIRADLIDSPPQKPLTEDPTVQIGDSPAEGMRKVSGGMESFSEASDRAGAQDLLDALVDVNIGTCEWSAVDLDLIRAYGRNRMEGQVEAAYLCTYVVRVDTTTRGVVRADATGYFYAVDGEFYETNVEQSNWVEERRAQ